jgi:hypothetical protein
MSLTRSNSCLAAALLAVVWLTNAARAEHPQFQPFIEPDYFNPDLQFFAPAEVSEFGGGEPPNTGFYATYDRLYINVSRPEGNNTPNIDFNDVDPPLPPDVVIPGQQDSLGSLWSPWEGDFTWGNRLDFGYMTEDKVGWNMVAWSISGPNENLVTRQERVSPINEEGPPLEPDEVVFPIQDRNPRDYMITQSINNATFSSFELNRAWRRKEFHNGGVFEPMIGVRYMIFNDIVRRDRYARYQQAVPPPVGDSFPVFETATGPSEIYIIDKTRWENNMLGPQIGFRLSKTYGHWHLSTEMRAFAMQNWQFFTAQQTRRYSIWNSVAPAETLVTELIEKNRTYEDNAEFVWGGEIRGEAAYEITRDISIRVGFTLMDIGQGVARSNSPTDFTDQDVIMGGVTFGLTMNR